MNGSGESKESSGEDKNGQILHALEVIYDGRSTNQLRFEAMRFLDAVKSNIAAPAEGFDLAASRERPPIARHFGLSLIEHAVRFRWQQLSAEDGRAMRDWIWRLAHATSADDPPFITNKIAEIWVELAKRSWALDWMDMDESLVQMWMGSPLQQNFVLTVLTMLSEDTFGSEDTYVALRGSEVNRACVEIFTPAEVLSRHFPNRETAINVRHGPEGWVTRLAEVLSSCVAGARKAEGQHMVTLRILSSYKTFVGWIIPDALIATNSLSPIFACLEVDDVSIQLAAMEVLHALYYRTKFSDDDFRSLIGPVLKTNTLNLLSQLYNWLEIDPTDIDDAKYLLLKKFSETLYNIGRLIAERPADLPEGTDLQRFLRLLLEVARSQSLQVSIPALHLWAKLLAVPAIVRSDAALSLIGELLETCSQRLVRYEAFPADATHPSILFLNEDIETIPERHAFLGNYSRFCNQIVELVVQQQPVDALYHILGQADNVLEHAYDGEPAFHPSIFSKNSIPFLKIDAQFTVIEAALKGCLKWLTTSENASTDHKREVMLSNLEVWCDRLIEIPFEDPMIKERVLLLSVTFATGPLRRNSQFAVRLFDRILETNCPSHPDFNPYTEAVKDLLMFCVHQMQRLAMKFPNGLMSIYDEVERRLTVLSNSVGAELHSQARYSSVLFIVMHRATNADTKIREERMTQMVQPLMHQWQDKKLEDSLTSFQPFTELLGLDSLQEYLLSRNVQKIEDWSSYTLDEDGKRLQQRIQDAVEELPLKATKYFLSVSSEKLLKPSEMFDLSCKFWQPTIPLILPNLLRFISLSQIYQDPGTWPNAHPDMGPIIRRIFTDRFWQVGISQGSRDEFYARIGGTRQTLEGLASSVRATMRTIREVGYKLLHYMSLLGDYFYSIPDLPKPLSNALFADARVLSPHQMSILVDMMKIMIDNCPSSQESHFLPPILSALFEQVDQKASSEWERIEERHRSERADEDLSVEMKDESILRQLTMAAVYLVAALLDPIKPQPTSTDNANGAAAKTEQPPPHSTRAFILRHPDILKPLILFCTHALRMHDTRACTMIVRVFRGLVPEYSGTASSHDAATNTTAAADNINENNNAIENDVREFISTSVLKACITSLHDPYFVDMQKDFAQLIASIFTTYLPRTPTPKTVILELPGMTEESVERAIRRLYRAQGDLRTQRAEVLQWLDAYRGVTIDEAGRLPRSEYPPRGQQQQQQARKKGTSVAKSALEKRYVSTATGDMDMGGGEGEGEAGRNVSPDLGGVAEMFA